MARNPERGPGGNYPGGPGGSRKGRPNRIGWVVKQNVIEVFELLGGIEGMVEWAKCNKTEFYRLYARLIPTEVFGTLNINDATELSDSELVAIASGGSAGAAVEAQGESEPHELH